MGVEIDLGFTFKLLDNLDFGTSFGYMWNGGAYKRLKGYRATVYATNKGSITPGDTVSFEAIWEDPKDSYVWYNTLTFAF